MLQSYKNNNQLPVQVPIIYKMIQFFWGVFGGAVAGVFAVVLM